LHRVLVLRKHGAKLRVLTTEGNKLFLSQQVPVAPRRGKEGKQFLSGVCGVPDDAASPPQAALEVRE